MMSGQTDVIIIGGGAAGLVAAGQLGQAGLSVRLLEARSRLGGRIHTLHAGKEALPVELGAEFIHGRSPHIWKIVNASHLAATEIDGENWCWRDSRLTPCQESEKIEIDIYHILRRLPRHAADQSFLELLTKSFGDERDADARSAATAYVEGFHAARVERIGVQALARAQEAADQIEGDRSFRLVEGYSALINVLRASLASSTDVRLNTVVKAIEWAKDSVSVTAAREDGATEIFHARRAVITLPLGVLKLAPGARDGVRFDPELPEKRSAMERLEVGHAARIWLRFRRRWWTDVERVVSRGMKDKAEEMDFLFARDEALPTWWTQMPARTSVLTGWAGGGRAEQFAAKGKEFIVGRAVETLARVFGIPRGLVAGELEDAYWHDWQSDPFAHGSYSYIAVGGLNASAELARPVEATLFFAGEATDTEGHTGTVHGAISTGARAAKEVMESLAFSGP